MEGEGSGGGSPADLTVVPTSEASSDAAAPRLDFERPLQLMQLAWHQGKSHFPCNTGRERSLKGGALVYAESFTAMVVADLLLDMPVDPKQRMLVRDVQEMLERELGDEEDVYYFFKEHERLPADADCTAVGLSVLLRGGVSGQRIHERANRALDQILANVSTAGVVETYFDPTGERSGIVDPVVCCNVLYLAFQLGRGEEAMATLGYVQQVLEEEAYLEGTRYYHSPDTFLYFLGRVVHFFPKETEELLLEPLRAAIKRRLGCSSYTLDVAQRAILCAWFEVDDAGELEKLRSMQEGDGFWPTDALFRYGRKKVYFGSRVMTSAFVMGALAAEQAAAERRLKAAAAEESADADAWEEISYERPRVSFMHRW